MRLVIPGLTRNPVFFWILALAGMVRPAAMNEAVYSRVGKQKMIRYEIIVYWSEEDQAFIAEVPELPGCAADGATYQEAIANAEVVIKEWIETATELGVSNSSPGR